MRSLDRTPDELGRRRRSRSGDGRIGEEDEVLHVAFRSRMPRVTHAPHRRPPALQPAGHLLEHIPYEAPKREKIKLPKRQKPEGYVEPEYPFKIVKQRF
jgi:hypothetical protein